MGFSTIGDFAETPSGGAGSAGHEGVDDQVSSNDDVLTLKDGEVVVNEDGDDLDFRVESDTKTHMLFVDGGAHQVSVNTSAAVNKSLSVVDSAIVKGKAVFTLTGSIDPAASATVTGSGTAFLTEVSPGDQLVVSGETRTVRSVTNDTTLVLDAPFTDNSNDASPDCNPAALTVLKDDGKIAFAVDGNETVQIGTCLKIQTEDDATVNQSARLFFKEEISSNVYGFSQFYTGDANPVFDGTTLTAPANSFNIFRHQNSATGAQALTIQRGDGNMGLGITAPPETLSVDGTLALKSQGSAPTVTTGYSKLFSKSDVGLDTAILMHFEGSDGATSGSGFADSGGFGLSNATRNGAEVDTAQYKFGSSSMLFDRSAGDYLDANGGAHNSAFDLGYGDFTIDMWVKFKTLDNDPGGSGRRLLSSATHNDAGSFRILYDSSQKWSFNYGSGATQVLSATADTGIAAATDGSSAWYHVAYVRTGNTVLMFRDGTLKGYGPLTTAVTWPGGMNIGNSWNTELTLGMDGWIDELRIVKRAMWLNNFTPPTQPYGDSTMQCVDGQGNVTRISPHNAQGEWEYFSKNIKTGKTVRINMEEVVRDLGELTGKDYIKSE